jgi:hypothetical protein
MVTHLHAQMNAFAFGQYETKPSASDRNWTIAGRDVCDVPESIT